MAKIILKLEGFENLDVRFLSEFLYNLKVYTTVLVEMAEEDKEIANVLINIDDLDLGVKYTKQIVENILKENLKLKYILENSNEFIKRKGKYNIFHSQKVKLEIKNISRGSWLIEFLLNLTPEQIEAYGNAISKIILVSTLNKLASNPKMAKYVKDIIIEILKK